MRKLISAGVLAAMVLAPVGGAIAQSGPKVFKPSSAWALDYGDDYCRLMRDFSNGDDTVGLFAERTQPGATLRLVLLGDGVKLFRGAQQIGYRFFPDGAPRMAPNLRFLTSDGKQYLNLGPIMLADIKPPAPGQPPMMPGPYSREGEADLAKAITGIQLEQGLTSPVRIDTGPLGDAVTALQSCTDDLVASWGLDAEKHKSLTRVAMPAKPTAGWLANNTISFEDFGKLNGGNNEVRVMVSAAGKATDCHIQWPTLDASTNKTICASVLENGAFLPALDRSGEAIDSYWTTNVFFLLPPFGAP